jgi:ribose transport system ATP-binding protein/rhamnose transport system ATP-binding protein
VGANGAGKSTLSRIISGHLQPDSGQIRIDARPVHFAGARDAIRSGVAMVMQETSLAPDLSVLENIMLPRLGMRGVLRWRPMRARVRTLLGEIGEDLDLKPDTLVRDLSIAQRQLVEIAKALALDSRILIFDEPTAALSPHESERLFDIIRELADRERGVIFVSHRLEEIFSVTDRVTVLREGKVVASGVPTPSLSQPELVRLMVGREVSDIYAKQSVASGSLSEDVVLRVRNLRSPPRVSDVSFAVRRGEIVGLAGLIGAGRSETLETIFGLRRASGGTIALDGRPFSARTPREAIRAGIGFVPGDRRGQGIVPDFSVRENLMLAHLGEHAGPGLGYGARSESARRLLELLELPQRRLLDANMLNFSGGMQQKVILARWLLLAPRLLLLDEPTRGVDIGTRSSIYALLRRAAADGVASVVVSSDFEEVIGIADRVVVLSDGASVTDIPSHLVDIERLTMFAAPRSSAERTHIVLGTLAAEFGGAAYWIDVDGPRMFCFDRVDGPLAPDPGFGGGGFPEIAETRIPRALATMGDGLIAEQDESLHSLLVPVHGRRGHRLGLVGLTLAKVPPGFDARAVRQRVMAGLDARGNAA